MRTLNDAQNVRRDTIVSPTTTAMPLTASARLPVTTPSVRVRMPIARNGYATRVAAAVSAVPIVRGVSARNEIWIISTRPRTTLRIGKSGVLEPRRLERVQRGIPSAVAPQGGMRTVLDHPAVLDHNNPVRASNG